MEVVLLLLHDGGRGMVLLHCDDQQYCKCGDGVRYLTNRTVEVGMVLLLLHCGEQQDRTVNVVMVLVI